jgi:hypothetical protein
MRNGFGEPMGVEEIETRSLGSFVESKENLNEVSAESCDDGVHEKQWLIKVRVQGAYLDSVDKMAADWKSNVYCRTVEIII